MNYEQFCIELEKRFDNQKIKDSKAKYLCLKVNYLRWEHAVRIGPSLFMSKILI